MGLVPGWCGCACRGRDEDQNGASYPGLPSLPSAGPGLRGARPLAACGLPVPLVHPSPWGPWTLSPQGESSHQEVASPCPSLPTAPPMLPWGPALTDPQAGPWSPLPLPGLACSGSGRGRGRAGAVGSSRAAGPVSGCPCSGRASSQWKSERFSPRLKVGRSSHFSPYHKANYFTTKRSRK